MSWKRHSNERLFAYWQKLDGTIYRERADGWDYLSPLFGEWLPVFNPGELDKKEMLPYPRNLDVHAEVIEAVLKRNGMA